MKPDPLRSYPEAPEAPAAAWDGVVDPDGIGAVALGLDGLEEPKLERLYRHWDEARGDRPWLLRADLRPEACPATLPHAALIERLPDALPFLKIRLTGEKIANPGFGFVKGRFVEAVTPDWYREHLMTSYMSAFVAGAPQCHLVRVVYRCQVILYRRLILPLSATGERVDMLLVASVRTRRLADFISFGRPDA